MLAVTISALGTFNRAVTEGYIGVFVSSIPRENCGPSKVVCVVTSYCNDRRLKIPAA